MCKSGTMLKQGSWDVTYVVDKIYQFQSKQCVFTFDGTKTIVLYDKIIRPFYL